MTSKLRTTELTLQAPQTWPVPLRAFLDGHHDLFLDWAQGPKHVSPASYDRAIYGLRDLLQPYSLIAWHCTRLTDKEVAAITANGMQPPNPDILKRRIDALVLAGDLTAETADQLKARNQADEASRRGRIWWCFYPPKESGEGGIRSLLETWGGEALYNSHDDHAVTGPLLRSVGTPSLIEADIPIALLGDSASPAFSVVAHYLAALGHASRDHLQFEDRIIESLPAGNIRRIVRYPDAAFVMLTGCDAWSRPPGIERI